MTKESDMQKFQVDDYLRLISSIDNKLGKAPVFVIGAGFSVPSLPSAWDLKKEIIKNIIIKSDNQELSKIILDEIDKEYFTLEVLGGILKYVCKDDFDPSNFWNTLNSSSIPNKTTKDLAILKTMGYIGPIITTNFDSFIVDSCRDLGFELNVVTSGNSEKFHTDAENSFIAVHGTCVEGEDFSDPSTVVSRDFTKPFTPEIYSILHQLLSGNDRDIIYAGYRGGDIYDMNIFLSNLKIDVSRHYWLSYSGEYESFSDFVNGRYKASIYSCKIGDLIGGVTKKLNVDKYDSFREKKNNLPWDLSVASELSGISKDQSQRTVDLIKNGSVAAWVALEHYLLISIGYDVKIANHMLGKGAKYYTLDLSNYIEAHERYWEENKLFRNSDKEVVILEKMFSDSRSKFLSCINKASEILKNNSQLSPLDLAMLKVIIASSYDYLGLCDLQYASFYEGDKNLSKSEPFRSNSIANFNRCISVCDEIEGIIGQENMEDYVPHYMWRQIAKENIARIVPRFKRAEKLRKVIKDRAELVRVEKNKGCGNTYLLAHYPQLWLRICELVKTLLNCSSNNDIPEIISDRDLIIEIEFEITRAEESIFEFEKLTNVYNSRKAVFSDAKVCFLLSQNKVLEAESLSEKYLLEAVSMKNSKAIDIMENTKSRINAFNNGSNKSN